jgi:DNA-binding winged helix-turn-helix (wHTH) protein
VLSRGLTRGATEIRITPKSLAVLHLLVQRAGYVVSKEELFRSVWPDTAVSDAALTSCIQELRRALGDDARRPRFIETLHRRGYRFVARTHSPQVDTVPLPSRPLQPHEDAPNRTLHLQAHHAAWATTFSRGDFEGAQRHAAAGQAIDDATQDPALAATYGGHDAGTCAQQFSARALAFLGRTSEAVEQSHNAIRQAEALEDPFSLAIAHVFAAAVDHARRDPASTREHAVTAIRIAQEQEFRLLLAWASVFAGWAAVESGCVEEGLRRNTCVTRNS